MENITNKKYSMIGLVTLFNPKVEQAAKNILRYANGLDQLLIWDNSPLEKGIKQSLLPLLVNVEDKIIWHGTGENLCIAPAINYAWEIAKAQKHDFILLMDQDSQWNDFAYYRETIEQHYNKGEHWVFTPYFPEHDPFMPSAPIVFRNIFINSGTVIPTEIFNAINGADEAFPLDALDTDMSYRIKKVGYQIACLTDCVLHHTIGQPIKRGPFHLFTNDYGRFRTYSITRGHIICYRKHRDIMTAYEKRKFFKEIFMWKLIRMILVENDKIGRFKMFFKGIKDGISYKIKN